MSSVDQPKQAMEGVGAGMNNDEGNGANGNAANGNAGGRGGYALRRSVHRVVNMSPGVKEILCSPEMLYARLHVRQEGDEVFLSIQVSAGDRVEYIPIVPRDQLRPKPNRRAAAL